MGFIAYVFLGQKKGRAKRAKKPFQSGGGYEAYKLRRALKKGNYKDSHVHKLFGKTYTT